MFKALIIDDEADARETLTVLLQDYCDEIELVGSAKDLPSGVKAIVKHKPDVIFLDIEMPEYNGLEILDFFDPQNIHFQIIFTTAYSEYAIQAFELSAVDYLLKPIQIHLLKNSIAKLKEPHVKDTSNQRLFNLKANFDSSKTRYRLALPVAEGIHFVDSDEILFIKADRAYSEFHLHNGDCITISKNLKEFEDILENFNFFRVHRSYLVNLSQVKQFIKRDGGFLMLTNKEEIPVSSDKKLDLLTKLSSDLTM